MTTLRRLLLICCLLFSGFQSQGQVLDTLLTSLEKRPKFFLNIVNYNALISREFANFSGIRVGLSYNKRVRFGFGAFVLNGNSVVSSITVDQDSVSYVTNGELNYSYISASAEYIFYHVYPWQFSIVPYNLGVGWANYRYNRIVSHESTRTRSETIVTFQPELIAQYSVFRWIGIQGTFGYRTAVFSSKNIRENFNSPTFSIGLKLFLDEIYKIAFPNGLLKKKVS